MLICLYNTLCKSNFENIFFGGEYKLNRVDIIKGIAMVRKSGLTNMFDRKNVIVILKEFGYNNIANYLEENKKGILRIINSK